MIRRIKKITLGAGILSGDEMAVEWEDGPSHGVTIGRADLPAMQELLTEAHQQNAPIERSNPWRNVK